MWLRKLMHWTMVLSVVVLVVGCAAKSGDYCDIAKPIWWNSPSETDTTPIMIARQIIVHNETWSALCRR